jgi:hypothetical protein
VNDVSTYPPQLFLQAHARTFPENMLDGILCDCRDELILKSVVPNLLKKAQQILVSPVVACPNKLFVKKMTR